MQTDQVMGNLTFNTNLLHNKIIAIKKTTCCTTQWEK